MRSQTQRAEHRRDLSGTELPLAELASRLCVRKACANEEAGPDATLQENEKFYREVTEIVAVCWMADFVIGKAGEQRPRRENPKQPPGLAFPP